MTLAELLDVVYRYYPRGLLVGQSGYFTSEEAYRQWEAARRGVVEYPTWKAMLRRLGVRYSVWDRSVRFLGASYLDRERTYDPAYSASLDIPGFTIGFHVSLLGPYYAIQRLHAPDAEEEEPVALDLAREIETTYPGYQPIPPELGDEVVPDVVDLGTTTIYQCLLSDWWGLSEPRWPWVNPPPDFVWPEEDDLPDDRP